MPIRGVVGWARAALSVLVAAGAVVMGVRGLSPAPSQAAPRAAAHESEGAFVDAAAHAGGHGLYLLDRAGGVHVRGEAPYLGSLPERGVVATAVAIVPTPSGGGGYLALDGDGGVFAFGDARFAGSVPALRAAGVPVGSARAVDLAAAPDGAYYVLDAAGGIFSFGGAPFFGSIPTLRAAGRPVGEAAVRDLVVARDGRGYWVTDSAGGIFSFGAVAFHGSAPSIGQPFSLTATAVIPDGSGYWMMDAAGGLLAFGTAAGGAVTPVPAPAPSGPGAFAFIATGADGEPIRFNPCHPIAYVVHAGGEAPGNARQLVGDAFRQITDATGIAFVDRGTTGETFSPRLDRPKWNHPSYGSGPTPVLISFEAPSPSNGLVADDAGLAGRQDALNSAGRAVVVTGSVVVNTALGLPADFSNSASYGGVLLHELGHLMGLDHVAGDGLIMSAVLRAGGPGSLQTGDREGLSRLGSGAGCVSDPTPR
ncbi:MAG: matrixin family metalloprotease [Actinobacteria bacterium]|nr:matrixin family metalloprotease [Actinomycetota bacterium]